ncbi:trypco2 family protein [Actinomadura fibrosa]|uniref:Trypco2 family protein n=1 Tax=Actinomadura fibrosa TaxID=111802 RepID=A0ABW2XGM6_9ACTN|nr:trypco2 family protein [Actinomadura fibrosa]
MPPAGAEEGPPALELVQAIDALRAQLTAAVERSEGQRVRFELGDVEIQLSVSITHDAKAEGKVKVYVLGLGASASESSTTAQTLKVTLKPIDTKTGRALQVADHGEAAPPR